MSVDSWGGGSDQDPQLRVKENAERAARERHKAAFMKRKAERASSGPLQRLWAMAVLAVSLYGLVRLGQLALAWLK